MPGRSRMKEALALAEQHGAAEAARRAGVKASTIRSHQSRERKGTPRGDDVPAEVAAPILPPPEPVEASTGGGRLEGMRRALAAARRVEAQAIQQTEALLAQGDAGEARNAAAAGGIWSDKALALEKAIVAAEGEAKSEAARLKGETLELQASVIRATFEAIGLPTPTTVMRELAACAGAGEPLNVPEDIAATDRERVRAAVRADLLPEVRQQVLDQLADEGLTHDDTDAEGDADGRSGAEAVEDPDPLSEAVQAAKLEEFVAENPGNREAAERRLALWVSQMEIQLESEARRRADEEEIGIPSDDELAAYLAESRDHETALRRYYLDRRQPGQGSKFAGHRPSSVAALREAPSGNPGGWA